jgi:hypothetical protein
MKKQIHIPNSHPRKPTEKPWHLPHATRAELPHLPGAIIQRLQAHRRQPGILDNLLAAASHDEACDIWTSFQNQNPTPAIKTVRKAMRILTAHMEGRIS